VNEDGAAIGMVEGREGVVAHRSPGSYGTGEKVTPSRRDARICAQANDIRMGRFMEVSHQGS